MMKTPRIAPAASGFRPIALTAAAAGAIGRNPEAAGAIRGVFIIGAAFAEGLGVLAIVLGILSLVL